MLYKHLSHKIKENKLIFIGLFAGGLFWVIESLLHVTLFTDTLEHKTSFFEQLMSTEVHELWMRLLVLIIILLVSIYAQSLVSIRISYTKTLEESNRLKELFNDIISHDLLNPIHVVQTSAELLLANYQNTDPEITKLLNMIQNSTFKLTARIRLASKFSQLENIERIEYSNLNLHEIVSDTLSEFGNQIQESDIEIIYLPNPNEEYLIEANVIIGEIFYNLISNAIKFSPSPGKIEIELVERVDRRIVSIKDQGKGIIGDDKEKIFARFVRLDVNGIQGLGLGLAIVKRIVQLHSGQIWVEDNPTGGSIFYVSLPKSRLNRI